MIIADPSRSKLNGFVGNVVQQATSVVTNTDQRCYEDIEDCYSIFAFEVIYSFLLVVTSLIVATMDQYKPGKLLQIVSDSMC